MKLINKRICAGVTSLAITATILNSMPITSRKDANIYAKAVESNKSDAIYGDVNSDDVIDIFDLILAREAVIDKKYIKEADLDGDKDLDEDDIYYLDGFLLGKTKSFPIYNNFDEDSDRVSDYLEVEVFGTNFRNDDTDKDGLSDYFEIYLLESDPKVEGKEALEDPDEDNLINLDESIALTDPFSDDTDKDNISDYDEVKKHSTKPLDDDSDGDGLTDADEIKLNLDPLNDATNGVPDGERIIEQVVEADNPILSEINTEENAYNLSLIVNASGCVDSCLEVVSSGYSYIMKDGSAIGEVPEFIYDEKYNVEDITLKFEIKEDFRESVIDLYAESYSVAADEELSGIKRLNIFKYFEEINSVMPIETQYDVDNNIVYVTISKDNFEINEETGSYEIGSYSLVDLEVWAALMNESCEETETVAEISDIDGNVLRTAEINILSDEKKSGFKDRAEKTLKSIFKNYAGKLINSFREETGEYSAANVVTLGGHKYAVINKRCSWEEAEKECERLGGHLMTLNNSFEFSFLQSALTSGTTKNHYWLGAYYSSGEWKWVDTAQRANFLYSLSKTISGYKATINHYQRYVDDYFYYADGMSYSRNSSPGAGAFICEWDSNSAYNRGRANLSGGVLINAGMNSYVLKAALTKGSKTDTDNDGIPDYDELDLKSIEKIGGKGTTEVSWLQEYNYIYDRYRTKATTIIPKWTSNNKITNALEKNGGTTISGTESSAITRTYPKMESNPTTDDTDRDYYIDPLDNEITEANPMVIPVKYIDDSDMLNSYPYIIDNSNVDYSNVDYSGNTTTTPVIPNDSFGRKPKRVDKYLSGGAVFSVKENNIKLDGNLTKGQLSYYRDINSSSESKFNLYIENPCDYEFVITFDNPEDVDVVLNDNNFLSVKNKRKDKMNYSKEKIGDNTIKYHLIFSLFYDKQDWIITINNNLLSGDFVFTIYQDNWVYAQNGAVRTGVYLDFAHINETEIYITDEVLYEIIKGQRLVSNKPELKSETLEQLYNEENFELSSYVEDFSDYVLNGFNLGYQNANDVMEVIGDYTGGVNIILLCIPGTEWIGGILTVGDSIMYIKTLSNKLAINQVKKAMIEGDLNICLSFLGNDDSPGFSAWNSEHYINRYYEYIQSYTYKKEVYRCDEIKTFNTDIIKVKTEGDDYDWEIYKN